MSTNGKEVLELLEQHPRQIDLAVLDVVMPKLDGRAVFERARAASPQVRFLFVSGFMPDDQHTEFIQDESLALLQKSYTQDALPGRVREVLDALADFTAQED